MGIRDHLTRKKDDYAQILAQINMFKSGLQYDKAFGLIDNNTDRAIWQKIILGEDLSVKSLLDAMEFQLNIQFYKLILAKQTGTPVLKSDFIQYKTALLGFLKANETQYFYALEQIRISLNKIN